MKITPSSLTISQLLSSSNELFFIPAYQRRYAWGFKQLAELFDDINDLNENDTHLLSTAVFLSDDHKAGLNKLEVVDGQQRITTIIILLKALKVLFHKNKKKDFFNEIDNYIFCKGIDQVKRFKVLLGDLDNPDFLNIMNDQDLDKVQNENLLNAYEWYKNWLEDNTDDINKFYYKLLNNLKIIRLDVSAARDAYKLFETINNRGLKLSPTDIIKNFLLGHASMVSENVLKQVRNSWKDLIINLDNVPTDNFFRQYLSGTINRKISMNSLPTEFKAFYMSNVKEASILSDYTQFENGSDENDNDNGNKAKQNNSTKKHTTHKKINLIKFSSELSSLSKTYGQTYLCKSDSIQINRRLLNLKRIKSLPSYIFLLKYFSSKPKEKEALEILRLIEIFMLRWHICEYRTNELDDIFIKSIELIGKSTYTKLKDHLSDYIPSDSEFREKFAKYDFKGNVERAKYILEMIEYHLIDHTGEYYLSSGKELHLEHIIPQTIKTNISKKQFGNWEKYLGQNSIRLHKNYVNLIGNYTLLLAKLNIKAQNDPFLAKKKFYTKSNITLNKNILKQYSSFKFPDVVKRSKELSKLAVKIWRF